jgi:hypothetical protein
MSVFCAAGDVTSAYKVSPSNTRDQDTATDMSFLQKHTAYRKMHMLGVWHERTLAIDSDYICVQLSLTHCILGLMRCMVAHCSNMQDLSRCTTLRCLTGHRTTIISSPLLLLLAVLHWTPHNTALTIPKLSLPHIRTSITRPDTETPTGHRTTITSSL